MKNKTAIEWLEMEIVELEINYEIPNRLYEFLEIAKQMEKEQIMNAFYDGCFDTNSWKAEQYYKENYGK